MNAEPSPLLDQLRDIHAAANPGWWPPAPGWWVVAILLLLVLFFAGRALVAHWRRRQRRQRYLAEAARLLDTFDPAAQGREYLAGVNRLFRIVAMKAFPETACASLQGESWVTFIGSLLPEKTDTSSLSALARGPYEPTPQFDRELLDQHLRTWVRLYG